MARRKKRDSYEDDFEPLDDMDDFEDSRGGGSTEKMRQLIGDLLGRWHWIAFGLVLGILGGLYYLSKAPKVYQTTSTLLVKQSAASLIPRGGNEDEAMDLKSDDAVNTVAERVKRSDLLTRIASKPEVLKLEGLIPVKTNWFPDWTSGWLGGTNSEAPSPASLDPAILGQMIGQWTSVSVRRNTRLLDITVEHPVPETASILANVIAEEYVLELGTDRADGRTSSSVKLSSRVEEAGKLLQVRENALANYQIILESLQKLEEKEVIHSEFDRRYLHKHPKLIAAKATLRDFRTRFLSEFELVRKAAADRDYWEETRPEWADPDLDENSQLQVARRLLTARATVLASEIESQKENYNALITKKLETDANKESVEAEVEVSELSRVPSLPASPKKAIALAGASIFGLGCGFALAFLLVKLDTKFHTVDQAELVTGLPVLATIRDIQPKILQKIMAEKGESSANLAPSAQRWDSRIVFRPGLSDTLYAEMFRILRASVTLLGDEKKRNVTLFSSALPGEGKTLVSTNFAIASAQQGKKTLLVDLDLRKPAVHKAFGLKRSETGEGVTEVLAGKLTWREALSTDTGEENLTCFYAGAKAPNPGELLTAEAIDDLLRELEGAFDVIVVDSAPLLAVPDTRLIIPAVDNFCLVVRAEQTPKGAVRKALDLLQNDGSEPAGVVLNGYQENTRRLGRKYRYGYGGYGQYGKGYGYGSYGGYGSDDDDD